MLVKATRLGYYNNKRIKEDTVFKLIDKKFSVMEKKTDKAGKEILINGKSEMVTVNKVLTAKEQFSPLWMVEVSEKSVNPNLKNHAMAEAEAAVQDEEVI